jgi:hypothetical protein
MMQTLSDFPDYALDTRESLPELASMARAGCDHDRTVPLEGSIARLDRTLELCLRMVATH